MTSDNLPWVISRATLQIATYCDLATSTSKRADYTVIGTGGTDDLGNLFVLNIKRGRWEWPRARAEIIAEILRQEVELVGVEKNGFQQAAFQELIIEPDVRHVAFVPVDVDTDKFTRALLVSAKAANGKLFIRKGASWKEDLIYEHTTFPGKHDDIVDTVSGLAKLLFSDYNPGEPAAPVSMKKPTGGRRRRRR